MNPVTATEQELTRDEIVASIDECVRRRRGMSARELLSAYRAGTLDDPGDVADLIALSDLLDEDDPVFRPLIEETDRRRGEFYEIEWRWTDNQYDHRWRSLYNSATGCWSSKARAIKDGEAHADLIERIYLLRSPMTDETWMRGAKPCDTCSDAAAIGDLRTDFGRAVEALQAVVDETAVVMDDERLGYIVVQMTRGVLEDARRVLAEIQQPVGFRND